jgi:hypothetical protein
VGSETFIVPVWVVGRTHRASAVRYIDTRYFDRPSAFSASRT